MSLVLKSNVAYTGSIKDLPYRYIFENLEVDALIGCSLMKSSYKGAIMRIERISDNTEIDIFPQNGKYINESEVLSFANGSDVRVATLYDQTGNSNHFARTDTVRRPFLIKGGAFQRDSQGLPAIRFDEGNQALAVSDVTLAKTTGVGFYVKAAFTGFAVGAYDTVRGDETLGIAALTSKNTFHYRASNTSPAKKTKDLLGSVAVPNVIKTYVNASTSQLTHTVNGVGNTQPIDYTQIQTFKSFGLGSGVNNFTTATNMRGLFSALAIFSSKNTADALL